MVFARKSEEKKVDQPLFALLGKKEVVGDVGMEIEVEGRRLPRTVPVPWTAHRDGSLRGAENMEYVFAKPVAFDKVNGAVDKLFKLFADSDTQLDDSNRTSVHVHLNITPFYMNRLASLMALWFIFEDPLTHWCGEHRVGNLFCMRAKDGPDVVRQTVRMVQENKPQVFPEGHHYAAMSPFAILKFGSLEFRVLRGCREAEPIKQWVAILKALYDASAEYPDPRTIVENFSYQGPLDFFTNTFKDQAESLMATIPLSGEQLRESLYEGMRFAQEICYARDWSDFNPVKVVPDPFGRKTVAVSQEEAPAEEQGNRDWVERLVFNTQNTAAVQAERPFNLVRRARPFRDLGN